MEVKEKDKEKGSHGRLSKKDTTMTKIKNLIEVYHEKVKELFGKKAKQKAREIGFEKRERKINASLFLMSLVCTVYAYGKITLSNLSSVARQIDKKCDASEQAFEKKFTKKALEFLQAMFAMLMRENVAGTSEIIPLISTFAAVYVLDSTTVNLPANLKQQFPGSGGSASEAASKVYLLLDWLSGKYESIKIMAGIKADQDMGKQFARGKKTNSLWLMGLGFWNLALFSAIKRIGSYFISRLHGQTNVYIKEKKLVKFDLDKFLAKAPRDRFFEFQVYLGVEEKLPVRLIILPVPKQAADERRRKLKEDYQKKGKTPSQKTLNRLDWNLFVTNVDPTILPNSTIPIVYKIRWQVELTFKLAKSDAQLDHTLSSKPNRVIGSLAMSIAITSNLKINRAMRKSARTTKLVKSGSSPRSARSPLATPNKRSGVLIPAPCNRVKPIHNLFRTFGMMSL